MDLADKERWESCKDHEISFWKEWLKTRGGQWPEDLESRLNPNLEFQPQMAKYLDIDSRTPRILDVGCGPLTTLGKRIGTRNIEIIALHSLGPTYEDLMKQLGIRPLVPLLCGEVEERGQLFPENYLDLF